MVIWNLKNCGLDKKDHANKRLLSWWEIYYSQKIRMITAPVSF